MLAADLRSLFEAARWAASSYNEQPWSYFVATKTDPPEFERLLSCLVEGNQEWAKAAPVLALGVVSRRFARNQKENRAAVHDLGLAAGNLLVEATARGLRALAPFALAVRPARAAGRRECLAMNFSVSARACSSGRWFCGDFIR